VVTKRYSTALATASAKKDIPTVDHATESPSFMRPAACSREITLLILCPHMSIFIGLFWGIGFMLYTTTIFISNVLSRLAFFEYEEQKIYK
jgi:hypothetical protein